MHTVVSLLLSLAVSGLVFADVSFWHGLTPISRSFCQNRVESECCGDEPCIQHELGWNDPVWCIVDTDECSIYQETCRLRSEVLYFNGGSTSITGSTGHTVNPGYGWPESYADVGFRMWDPDTLYLYYEVSFDTGGAQPVIPVPTVQMVVFWFDGNPAALAALGALDYVKLITSGLVGTQDVLYFDVLLPDDTWHAEGSAFVDLAGMPPDEILVLASGHGILPNCEAPPGGDGAEVPAVGGWGTPALLLLMLAASAAVLRGRRIC